MADTRTQLEVEDWIRREWLPGKFKQKFSRERLKLSPGGVFDFDAVSENEDIAAVISTSGSRTATGNHASGKIMKIRSDIYFLLLVSCKRRIVVFSEQSMHDQWMKEIESGRVPSQIEFFRAEIPQELASRLRDAQAKASKEVSPGE